MARKKRKRVTAMDVAKRAGVSHTAVSMALRGSPEISEERAEAIRKIAREMSYFPRADAQFLRAGRTGQLGIIVATSDAQTAFYSGFIGPVLANLVDFLSRKKTPYLIEYHHHSDETVVPNQVTSGLVDGSLVIGDIGDPLRKRLDEVGHLPWVNIDEPAPFSVLTAHDRGIIQAVEQLAELGHRRIAFAHGPRRYTTHRLAREGFQQAVQKLELTATREQWICELPSVYDANAGRGKIQWARQLLAQSPRPTAVVCNGETIARAVILAAAEAGIDVPSQLSVISRGPVQIARWTYPALTTIDNDEVALGQEAVDLLSRQIHEQPITDPVRWVEPRLVAGETVAPAPAA